MRTKTLICAAALAAGALSSWAQVLSLNVVGYVNDGIIGNGSYNFICNPLNNANNNITNIFPAASQKDGNVILRWDPVAADFQLTTYSFSTFFGKWLDNNSLPNGFNLNPGEGIFYINNDSQ